ncbi:hypothetical protein ACYPKM_05330 [Pseudomonas aeruginosa]
MTAHYLTLPKLSAFNEAPTLEAGQALVIILAKLAEAKTVEPVLGREEVDDILYLYAAQGDALLRVWILPSGQCWLESSVKDTRERTSSCGLVYTNMTQSNGIEGDAARVVSWLSPELLHFLRRQDV